MQLPDFTWNTHRYAWSPVSARARRLRALERGDATRAEIDAAVLSGDVPPDPASALLGLRLLSRGDGRAMCALDPAGYHSHGFGSMQAGMVCSVVDATIQHALESVRPAGVISRLVELKANFARAIAIGAAEVRCEAEVLNAGRETALLFARVLDGRGKLCVVATASAIFSTVGAAEAEPAAPASPGADEVREHELRWVDGPELSRNATAMLASAASQSEIRAAVAEGKLPLQPALECLHGRVVSEGDGRCTVAIEPAAWQYGPEQAVQSGLLCVPVDYALVTAFASVGAPDEFQLTLDLKANFVRPATAATGTLRCVADVIDNGWPLALAQARVLDAAGALYAYFSTTVMPRVLRPAG